MIGDNTIDLLGHLAVETAQTRLDMRERNMQFCRRQRSRERGIGIAKDDHPIWPLIKQHLLDSFEHAPRLCAMRTGTTAKMIVRLRQGQLLEELLRHGEIIVLAGMNQAFMMPFAKRSADWRKLHKFRPRPHYCCYMHSFSSPPPCHPERSEGSPASTRESPG